MKIIDTSGKPKRKLGRLVFNAECECHIPPEQVTRDLVKHIVALQKNYNIEVDGEIEIGEVDAELDAEDILTVSAPGNESADVEDEEDEDEDEDK